MRFKNLEGKSERESTKRTIFASGGLGWLQMVLELDTGRCASEEAKPRRRWTWGGVPTRTLGSEGGGLGRPTLIGEGNEC